MVAYGCCVCCCSPLSPVLGVCVVADRLLGNKIICLTSTLECIVLPLLWVAVLLYTSFAAITRCIHRCKLVNNIAALGSEHRGMLRPCLGYGRGYCHHNGGSAISSPENFLNFKCQTVAFWSILGAWSSAMSMIALLFIVTTFKKCCQVINFCNWAINFF